MKAGERYELLRAAWQILVARKPDAQGFVFVDEMGAHTALAPVYEYLGRAVGAGDAPQTWEEHDPASEQRA